MKFKNDSSALLNRPLLRFFTLDSTLFLKEYEKNHVKVYTLHRSWKDFQPQLQLLCCLSDKHDPTIMKGIHVDLGQRGISSLSQSWKGSQIYKGFPYI